MTISRAFITVALILSCSAIARAAVADDRVVKSGETQVHLIELFSSEGCSSCPPADAWLSTLKRQAGLWKSFVPIEFHVDYWNRLGWTDRFSRESFTERQRRYAAEWGSDGVYTPGFVLDGAEWRPSSAAPPAPSTRKVGTLTARRIGPRRVAVSFAPQLSSSKGWRVYGAVLGNGLVSKVGSGENAGRSLRHDFVVLGLASQEMHPKEGARTAESPSFAIWVARAGSQSPVQAVGGGLQ
jgi:hypothetical protein